MKRKFCLLLCMLLLLTGTTAIVLPAQARSGDLNRVTIVVKVENPDYFWHYPFQGKQLDQITIASFGKVFTIPALTDTEEMEIEVPTGYYLRLNIHLQAGDTTLQSIPYISKKRVRPGNTNFTLVLKAPEPQPFQVSSDDFEAARP